MQKNQSYQTSEHEQKSDKYRRNIHRFIALAGVSAVIGLFATDPEYATNVAAQEIGYYAAIFGAIGIIGAFWNWSSLEDLKSGRTIASELNDIKARFAFAASRLRKEFDDEFATNQGLDEKETEVTAKAKVTVK